VRQAELTGRVRDRGRRRPLERDILRTGIWGGPVGEKPVVDDPQPASPQSIARLPASNGDDPRANAGLAAERSGAPPHREHRVLEDLLAQPTIARKEINLGEHYPCMPVVQRHEGNSVPAAHSVQQVDVVRPWPRRRVGLSSFDRRHAGYLPGPAAMASHN
jgi:hypothetical protein